MRAIVVTVTQPPNPGVQAAIASGVPTGAGGRQLNLTGTPTGGSNTNTWQGTASVSLNVLTVVTTTSGAMSPGALSGQNLPPNIRVTGPGPTAGTWLLSQALQAPLATQAMRLNEVVTLDAPRQVLVTSTSDPANAVAYTIYGTDASGNPIQETLISIAGGTGIPTIANFATVTQVVCTPGLGNLTSIGTSSTPISPPVMFDPYVNVAAVTKSCTTNGVTGTTYNVQITNDDPNSPTNPVPTSQMAWVADPQANFVGATSNQVGAWAFAPVFARVLLTSATPAGGSVTATFVQQGGQ